MDQFVDAIRDPSYGASLNPDPNASSMMSRFPMIDACYWSGFQHGGQEYPASLDLA